MTDDSVCVPKSRRQHVKDWAAIILIPLAVVGSMMYANWRYAQVRCEATNEFRAFFAEFLDGEVGVPLEDAPGIDRLSPEVREFLEGLRPALDAGREERAAKAAEFRRDFPQLNC